MTLKVFAVGLEKNNSYLTHTSKHDLSRYHDIMIVVYFFIIKRHEMSITPRYTQSPVLCHWFYPR